jgi:hypothetical protein
MPKYAQFDPVAPSPQPVTGWYDTDEFNYPNLPPSSSLLQLTQAQWDARQSTPFIQSGQLIPAPAPTLTQARGDACTAIDAQAGATRAKYITTAPGQPETYQAKAADANAYKAAGYPSASIANYPWVQAEAISINGAPTAAQIQAAADGIIATATAWIAKGAAIEQQRRAGKIAVGNAATVAAVQSAAAAAIAALQAL